jgi:hypothetical protein
MKRIALLLPTLLAAADEGCLPGAAHHPNDVLPCQDTSVRLGASRPCYEGVAVPGNWGFKFDVSALAWQAQEDGLYFAAVNSPRFSAAYGTAPNLDDVDATLETVDFDWDPGVKVNLGVEFPTTSFDLDTRWTFFYSHSEKSLSKGPLANGSALIPVWMPLSSATVAPNFVGQASADWHLHFNTIDFELGYGAMLTHALSLRLSGGLKAVSIDQDYRVAFANGLASGSSRLLSANSHSRNDALGLGGRLGFNSRWRLGKGFSLLGDFSGALVLYRFRVRSNDQSRVLNAGVLSELPNHFHLSYWAVRPNIEYALGFGYDTCFRCRNEPLAFAFDVSYEGQHYYAQNNMALQVNRDLLNQPYNALADLHLHGVTMTFRLEY